MKMARKGTSSFPLDALSTEVVEMILKSTEDSSDVINVFKVFPSLEGRVIRKRFEWQFDRLVPLIFPWLDKATILNCRLVSRRWARGFDRFLENSQPNGQCNVVAITSNQRDISREASRVQNEIRRQLAIFSFQHRFGNWKKLAKFERKMARHHLQARNPFIGRKMSLFKRALRDTRWFWWEAEEFLGKFGDHIWYLEMDRRRLFNHRDGHADDEMTSYSGACNALIRSLRLLPNLREMIVYMPYKRELIQGPPGEEFPAGIMLPHLESLTLVDDEGQPPEPPSPIYSLLVELYANQLKKLEINYRNWRPHYSQILVKLEELTLFRESSRMEEVISVMASLRAPELRRLELHMAVDIENVEGLQKWIGSWLEPFPKLGSAKMVLYLDNPESFGKRLWQSGENSGFQLCDPIRALIAQKREIEARAPPLPVPIPVTSLKSLSVELCYEELGFLANFDFLRFFPNLEYLDINCLDFKGILYFRELGVYDPKIWDVMLPKLKELNMGEDGSYKFYARAGYEWIPDLGGLFSLSNGGTGEKTVCK